VHAISALWAPLSMLATVLKHLVAIATPPPLRQGIKQH